MNDLASRREFVGGLCRSGAALAAGSWLTAIGHAETAGPARAVLQLDRTRAELDRRLLGAFLEHLGRAIYTGVYEPGSKLADADGFRKDVLAEVQGLGVPIVRYPGGNFVSGYNWLDGVGPKDKRPTRPRAGLELPRDEPVRHQRVHRAGAGSWAPSRCWASTSARARPRWPSPTSSTATSTKGTRWSDLRREHGYEEPHHVKYWCLGNEMDGPWQMGHMTAREYGRKARDSARQIRVVDPGTQLIACGSSNTILATYLDLGSRGPRGVLRPGGRPSRCTTTTATRPSSPATTPPATSP